MRWDLLDASLMHKKLKNSWTTEDFARYLECTEEEFLEAIKKVFSKNSANNMISDLKRNMERKEKAIKNCRKRSHGGGKIESNLHEDKEKQVVEELEENNCEEETIIVVQEEASASISSKSREESLEELYANEKKIRQEICDTEAAREQLIGKRRKLNTELFEQKKKLIELRSLIVAAKEKVLELTENLNNVAQEISDVNLEISYKNTLLNGIKEEIINLKKVTIFVFENGEIEIDGLIKFYEAENWKVIFQQFTGDDAVEDLSIKQIKQLAKVIAFVDTLENGFEVIFDNELLQEIFEKRVCAA